ncbi:hypothetical protein M436DRAFT_60263 [Aureobasidium namibiae CBS 147.97]|uniref:Uncharacterized protein n=1 Tax=Aureobasidium namibiae CBS 147.97 TaxID=1043004 RepID=A0A074WY27_9PEZI
MAPTPHLISRAPPVPCAGCLDPSKVNNKVYFSLFALIFLAIVLASIWFFFHAKNGGFHWQQGDFDDWKSTVLRKKDANGNTIYSARSVVSRPRKSDRIAAKSVVGFDEKGRKGIMAVRGFGGSHSVYYSDGFTQYSGDRSDAMTSISRNNNEKRQPKIRGGGYSAAPTSTNHSRRYRDRDLRDYKHEKPARVGGMNRSADGTSYDYSDRSETLTEMTETSSAAPILSSSDRKREKAEKRAAEDAARMERKWRKEAERAAAALAKESTAATSTTPRKPSSPVKSHTPVTKAPKSSKRQSSRSRSSSPRKSAAPRQRDYSFSGAPDESSTVYTGTYTTTSGTRTNSSYYDAYRPVAQASPSRNIPGPSAQAPPRAERRERRASSSRNNSASPSKQHRSSRYTYADSDVTASTDRSGGGRDGSGKYERVRGGEQKKKGGRDVMAGYRRGMDSLGSDSE